MGGKRTFAALLALGGGALLARGATRRRPRGSPLAGAVEIQRSITIQHRPDEVYERWRDPATQALVWEHAAVLSNVTHEGAHWRVPGPFGRTFEWDARIVEERHGELIRWEATGGDVPNEGSAEFRAAPGDHATELTLRVRFDPPAGALGRLAARFFDEPPKLVLAKALRRFKSLVETGEIPSTERNPSARQS